MDSLREDLHRGQAQRVRLQPGGKVIVGPGLCREPEHLAADGCVGAETVKRRAGCAERERSCS